MYTLSKRRLILTSSLILCIIGVLFISIFKYLVSAPVLKETVLTTLPQPDSTYVSSTHLAVFTRNENGKKQVVVNDVAGLPYDYVSPVVLSSDGLHYLYSARRGESYLVIVDGKEGKSYDEIKNTTPTFSSDSSRYVYWARKGEHIYAVSDTGESNAYDYINPASFSQSGKRLFYKAEKSGKDYAVIDGVAGDPFDEISVDNPSSHFSPDSSRFAYIARSGGSWFVVTDGEKSNSYYQIKELTFSSQGNRIGFVGRTSSLEQWVAVVDGKEGQSYDAVDNLVFSPDGSKYGYRAFNGDVGHVVIDTTQGAPYSFSQYESSGEGKVVFNVDGSHYAYEASKPGSSLVMVVNGTELSQNSPASLPVFSPDGKRLAYIAYQDTNKRALIVDGTVFYTYEYDVYPPTLPEPVFSPDSSFVYAEGMVGGKQTFITNLDGASYETISSFVQSKSGHHYAYSALSDGINHIIIDGIEKSSSGTGSTVVSEPFVSDSGTFVSYIVLENGEQHIVMEKSNPLVGTVDNYSKSYDTISNVKYSKDNQVLEFNARKGTQILRVEQPI